VVNSFTEGSTRTTSAMIVQEIYEDYEESVMRNLFRLGSVVIFTATETDVSAATRTEFPSSSVTPM
jgi:hypothetical protein